MSYTLKILRRAATDVNQIHDWIAERSPGGAARWYAAFRHAATGLLLDPSSHALAAETEEFDFDIRERFFKTRRGNTYRILFTVVENEVRILRIRGPGQPPVSRRDIGV